MPDFEQLKTKYSAVLQTIKEKGVVLAHLNMQDNKLYLQGAAPSEDIKNAVWNAIKSVDASFSDLTCDLSVDSSLPQPATAPTPTAAAAKTYAVQPGDSLSKIAKEFYGNASEYPKIFEANRDKLDNPDHIKVGQVLTIP